MHESVKEERFNKVSTITAICRTIHSWDSDVYKYLEVGKTYTVSHIGVGRSKTDILLEGYGDTVFNSTCFEFYENGISIDNSFGSIPRFIEPRLRRNHKDYFEWTMEHEAIPDRIKEIEKKYDIRILLAVESGSRAWGFASKDSDWDVRFIYVHKPEWYFSVDEKRDVIEEMFEDDIDAVGWDIRKTLALLKRSNPSLMEWINSPIVYTSDKEFIQGVVPLSEKCFNPLKTMYHYQRIYIKQDERYLQKKGYPMKRFMYYLRGILACQWIDKYKTLPPVLFQKLYEDIVDSQEIKDGIRELVLAKTSGKEMDMSEVPNYLVKYCLPIAEHYSKTIGEVRPQTDTSGVSESIDKFFYETVIRLSTDTDVCY